ncbi:protein unc-80 homolog [Mytilus californianus]|uniref:protein unc-80 homolog n=1 Tax=Mytilus californianus TaxID=6549 RepID=UPI0022458FEE|nr:protein unc-80 homolog [Mytilus californianus]
MPKRKNLSGDDGDQSIPLPIQAFFWRQTSPFIRPKRGKLCEAAVVSLERVVVQNILHGASPSLCEAIQSVSRWKVIQAAFPHVMHACSSLLAACKQNQTERRLGPSESKLLYILHWIILDAASECEDLESDPSRGDSSVQMHTLTTIQLFIYLFAPLIHLLEISDFQTLKLENGLQLWQPLWDYRQPDITCFAAPVKPQRNILKAQRNMFKFNTNAANIYIGKGSSRDNLAFPFGDPVSRRTSCNDQSPGDAPLVTMSDICHWSMTDSQSVNMEVICEFCNTVVPSGNSAGKTCQCGKKNSVYSISSDFKMPPFQKKDSIDREFNKNRLISAVMSGTKAPGMSDILSASYFDVAVLRCLFCLHWSEEGIYWALRYIQQRMLEVCDENTRLDLSERERSYSLPIPDIQILQRNSTITPTFQKFLELKKHRREKNILDKNKAKQAAAKTLQTIPSESIINDENLIEDRKQPPLKKTRVDELKLKYEKYIDSRNPSPEKEVLNVTDSSSSSGSTADNEGSSSKHQSYKINPGFLSASQGMSHSLKMKLAENKNPTPTHDMSDQESAESSNESSVSSHQGDSFMAKENKNPIIMVTEHTPKHQEKMLAMLQKSQEEGQNDSKLLKPSDKIPRSMTDSDISYQIEDDVSEVSGSVYYIQDNGQLNYKIVLRAVHFISTNQRSQRVAEVLLNIINCLLDLDIIERKSDIRSKPGETNLPNPKEETKTPSKCDLAMGKVTAHGLAMDSLISIFKSLGCPNGCGDGLHGSYGDHLRAKGHNCLQRLQRINSGLFRSYLRDTVKKMPVQETIDFLHSFLGFCIDPSTIRQASQTPGQGFFKSSSTERMSFQQNGFHNNFGHSIGGLGYRGVEGVLITNILKPFISKCVENTRELYSSDNISMFCDIRQFIAYVKEIHGGTFRRVELSGLLDSLDKLKKKEKEREEKIKKVIPMRRTTSQTSESGDEKESSKNASPASGEESGKPKKSLFKKKIKKSLALQLYAASDSELLDELRQNKQGSNTDDDSIGGSGITRRRFSKFHIGWKRAAKSDHEEEAMSDPHPLDRRDSKSDMQVPKAVLKGKMSFKTASHAAISLISSSKRIQGGLKNLGKRMNKRGSTDGLKNKDQAQNDDTDLDFVLTREKKLVDKYLIKSGMLRFSFLLECCHPGSIPDPQLIAAMLELDAPVIARASLLLECAQFIHRCNHGDWPNWMRLNIPSFRNSASALQNRGQPSGYRRTLTLQKAAGRMFYSWAENLGLMMEYILAKEHKDRQKIISDIQSETTRKELKICDEDEDFLDEGTVNVTGSACPYALKMMACLVLQEITTFLRETFRDLPKGRSPRRDTPGPDRSAASRRWSSIVSSPIHSQSSESNMADMTHSASGVTVGSPGTGDRKISFAVLGEKSDSVHSSTTSLSAMEPGMPPHTPNEERKGRRLAQGRPKLLKHFRRGSGANSSFRHNRSFRLKRQEGGSIKRFGSIKSRKVSSQSLQSDKVMEDEDREDGESVLSDENEQTEAPETDDFSMCRNMPWVRVVVQLANLSNFICTHQNYCHPDCYERQRRSCSRMITAMKKVYQSTENDSDDQDKAKQDSKEIFRERLRRRESVFHSSSPTRRRESTPLLEKIKTDVSMGKMKLTSTWKKEEKLKEVKEDTPIMKYINSQAQKLTQCPMGILAKAAPILTDDNFSDILPVAWELMIENDQELAASAASVFLLTSVKAPEKAQSLIVKQLQHEDAAQRVNAVLRFGTLWKFRHQVWPRMEDGANLFFKLPPPNIDFTLPSPTIGLPMQSVVDPPWTPHFKAKIEEVTVNQEETKSLVTATTTRRKEQQEMIRKALQAEEERKRIGRENFQMTTVPVPQLAADEPALHHATDEHEEVAVIPEELNLAARRVSLAPANRANMQGRSLSWRNGSVHWSRGMEGEEERTEHVHHVQMAQSFFPSCICACVLPIIHMLDDGDVNSEGISVSEVSEKVIWNALVDDPVLFLRHFLEKLTVKDKLDKVEELLFLLRKLILHFQDLPAQMAHSLFNYLIGYVMFYVRSPCAGSQEAIGGALALIWQVIPSVEGIYFKDLKQTLKKEQCDPYLLISAMVPSAKKIIVHGPDQTSIPTQLPIHEDTQFSQILQESLEFFNIPEEDYPSYFLVDSKSNQIHNLNSYVRDFYFFRRNFYPQLSLVNINPDKAFQDLDKQAFTLKFVEIGKVLFTTAVLKNTPPHQLQNHVSFLHEEFLKLPSFPRKALEAEFGLYGGNWGQELYGLDTLHKYSWVKLMTTMFDSMTSTFAWSSDLQLFLNVINGCIILHCEDSAMLRFCLMSLINTCIHFKYIFSMNGFMYIMPSLLKTYSNNQPNPVLCSAIQFVCKTFYILHRKPFILQMFGSIVPLLDESSSETGIVDCRKIQPDCLFELLMSLGKDCPDNLCVLDLVESEKPLKALDFCYENDPDRLAMIDVINMCVTVIAYAPDSFRSVQMLKILEVLIPRYLGHLKKDTNQRDNPPAARSEITVISNIAISIKALLCCSEFFTRNMSLPQRQFDLEKSSAKVQSNHSPLGGTSYYDDREDSHASRHMEEGRKKTYVHDLDDTDLKNDFRKPRDLLLNVIADFYSTCQVRLKELRRILADPSYRPPDLLDFKSHNRLAEIANTLLKLAPYDAATLGCTGLQRYMVEILPITDWKQEAVRPGLNLILRRLDRLFNKISKKSSLRRQADWDAAANLLKGVFLTLRKFQYIAHLPHLKTLVSALLSIVLCGPGGPIFPDSLTMQGSQRSEQICHTTPPSFCSAVIKLVAMQMQALGDQFNLEQVISTVSTFTVSPDRSVSVMVNFILPLCIRMGAGRRETPRLRHCDVSYALSMILNMLSPPPFHAAQTQHNNTNQKPGHHHHLSMTENHRCSSFSHHLDKRQDNELVLHVAFLGLEILMTCFDKVLSSEWHKVARCIQDMVSKGKVSLPFWKFLDFIVTYRPSLYLMLHPFIQFKMMKVNCDMAQEYYLQQTIKDKLQGYSFQHPKCSAGVVLMLAGELQQIKEDIAAVGAVAGEYRSRTCTMTTDRSQSQYHDHRRHASITDVNTETIISATKPSLANIGKRASKATILSQSSCASAPFRNTVLTSSMDSATASPEMGDKRTRRISARDGSSILEKFQRPTIEDISPGDAAVISDPPRLQRQPTICFRSPETSKQSSIDEIPAAVLYENEEYVDMPNGGGAIGASNDLDPRPHRLQRQDAKSRKTFKRKRTAKTTSMRRYLPKSHHHDTYSDAESQSLDTSPTHRMYSYRNAEQDIARLQQARAALGKAHSPSLARSEEMLPETVEMKTNRQRYIQRSKSHDDPHVDSAPGTVKGRIARQGARIVRSRSPSSSPVRSPVRSPVGNAAISQAYISHYDSTDSLNANEFSSLLKDNESTDSSPTVKGCYTKRGSRDTVV